MSEANEEVLDNLKILMYALTSTFVSNTDRTAPSDYDSISLLEWKYGLGYSDLQKVERYLRDTYGIKFEPEMSTIGE